MENFISLALSMIVITWYYINCLRLNFIFTNGKSWFFTILSVFTFSYIYFLVFFLFVDSMTIIPDKQFLRFKEDFALSYLLVFEIFILIIAPCVYVIFLNSDFRQNENENFIDEKNSKNFGFNYFIYFLYLITLILTNIIYLKLNIFSLFKNEGKNEICENNPEENFNKDFHSKIKNFGNNVPLGLAKFAYINNNYQKIVYFNFGLLMMFGKFLGFTYLPFGMSKYVHDIIFQKEDPKFEGQNLTQKNQNEKKKNFKLKKKKVKMKKKILTYWKTKKIKYSQKIKISKKM